MFGKRITLFRLFNFEVRIDVSWLVIGILITWSLAKGLFPYRYKDLSEATYWWMGVAGAIGLFFSIVFHELFHSLVARRFDINMKGITLFIFGGVAEMEEEPRDAKAEFFMALAGPLSSIVLGLIFIAIYGAAKAASLATPFVAVMGYLAALNIILAAFNLIPAYPLDGGRVLRSILWHWKKNLKWATRIASRIGAAFGMALIFFGILSFTTGNLIGGIWWFMIGMFLRNASQISYQQIFVRKALEGEKVLRFMKKDPVCAPPGITLAQLVEEYIYRYHYKMFPVVDQDRLVGCITTRRVKEIPREEWVTKRVSDVALPCNTENTITPDSDAVSALTIMNRTGNSRLMVIEDGKLTGIITLKDIMSFLSVKLDLDENQPL